eukprot:Hpha_TRINITY_DN16479_c4_g1::TRINITY_DN16479_c4_g1_i3::g.161070::m.161070
MHRDTTTNNVGKGVGDCECTGILPPTTWERVWETVNAPSMVGVIRAGEKKSGDGVRDNECTNACVSLLNVYRKVFLAENRFGGGGGGRGGRGIWNNGRFPPPRKKSQERTPCIFNISLEHEE